MCSIIVEIGNETSCNKLINLAIVLRGLNRILKKYSPVNIFFYIIFYNHYNLIDKSRSIWFGIVYKQILLYLVYIVVFAENTSDGFSIKNRLTKEERKGSRNENQNKIKIQYIRK